MKPASCIYHYTDRASAGDIVRQGVVRASAQTLYRRLEGPLVDGPRYTTEPLTWWTINHILEQTVLVKLALARPGGPIGNLCRVVLPHPYGDDLGLYEYTQGAGIDPTWWEWVIRTGDIVGSHYTCWRIVPEDVIAADWVAVEVLTAFADTGTIWSPLG